MTGFLFDLENSIFNFPRNLTTRYYKLLTRATKEIKKLNLEKMKLERENIKLLVTNVEMAEETKNLILEKKQWKKIEQVRIPNINISL